MNSTNGQQIRQLRCDFTDEELLGLSKQIAESQRKLETLMDEKKKFSSTIKSRIDQTQSEIRMISNNIHDGWEFRPIKCDMRLNFPRSGHKSWIRTDTGEIAETVLMDEDDKQLSFDDVREADAVSVGSSEDE
jgi:hypothetical protein